jgi:phosphate transport system substrate-binding protein
VTLVRGADGKTHAVPPRILLFAGLLLALLTAGCGRGGDDGSEANGGQGQSGSIVADGSSTVGPFVSTAAEKFRAEEPDVKVTVGISGTGGGFERFCRGETDLSNASRAIEPDETAKCKDKGIEFVELQVANDGIANIVNEQNAWAKCLTVAELKKIWNRGSKVDSWDDVDSKYPNEKMTLAGPGTDSGTFDFFTKAINGEEGVSRTDYQPSEDDNIIVQAVAGDKGGFGYLGLSYYEENTEKLNAVAVDAGSGCVEPTRETVQSGKYKPLSRPLFVYVKKSSLERPEVKAFLEFMLDHQEEIAGNLFVPLTDAQRTKARQALSGSGY